MESFACCSRWQQCCQVMKCINPGTGNISQKEFEAACATAQNYKLGKNYLKNTTDAVVSTDKLIIVDGNSLIHRAYYAIQPLMSPAGHPTNAIYGMLKMMFTLLDDINEVSYLLVAFDAGSFRKEIYADYKKNRKDKPPDLISQLQLIKKVLDVLNIAYLDKENYEADDIIGTVTKAANSQGVPVIIVTGDKDCIQLVNDRTSVYLTRKGVSNIAKFTSETTKTILGYGPELVVQIKALAGDSSDNIPGVAGVGEKTALKLLKEYGSLDNVIKNANIITGKLGEKILSQIEMIKLSKELATINVNVPVSFDLEKFKLSINVERGTRGLARLGINSINLAKFKNFKNADSPVEVFSEDKGINISGVKIQFEGSPRICGVCIKHIHCCKFIELDNNKRIMFGAKIFWVCPNCERIIDKKSYKKISATGKNVV